MPTPAGVGFDGVHRRTACVPHNKLRIGEGIIAHCGVCVDLLHGDNALLLNIVKADGGRLRRPDLHGYGVRRGLYKFVREADLLHRIRSRHKIGDADTSVAAAGVGSNKRTVLGNAELKASHAAAVVLGGFDDL